jgi:hypothetical protein
MSANDAAALLSYLYTIAQALDAGMGGAVGATENAALLFYAMTNHLAAAVLAGWGQCGDRTLERIEGMLLALHRDRKRFVVIVSTKFAAHF